MLTIEVPGYKTLHLRYLVTDVNGTLAVDGKLLPGVEERIARLRAHLEIYMLTANTHGRQHEIDAALGLQATIIQAGAEAEQKARFVADLGSEQVVALGQGANDAAMLRTAGLGICVLSPEGLSSLALQSADLIMPDILSALDALLHPARLKATLRR
jgi:P-type E1-E2 ATPase